MQIREIELPAPAKNKDIGIAAINCGADSLYIAGPSFGAREFRPGFDCKKCEMFIFG